MSRWNKKFDDWELYPYHWNNLRRFNSNNCIVTLFGDTKLLMHSMFSFYSVIYRTVNPAEKYSTRFSNLKQIAKFAGYVNKQFFLTAYTSSLGILLIETSLFRRFLSLESLSGSLSFTIFLKKQTNLWQNKTFLLDDIQEGPVSLELSNICHIFTTIRNR